ncbi:hypothetical protein FPZ12_023125 [Amycolatopsis acidicola]|uniref:Ada DNA repair metal-binding domain-containing protein n=1 Tax=Amycolatopsis acidicola TaxID=2596893 RepID=A0A5N0V0X4_9PSEU|nr:Ada metal-binding domain-containing protein [Amycolatopsis acidicola]KAA9158235.1 hypothetical protein FPZ12_023125 [Amycolatopsis acidicola]
MYTLLDADGRPWSSVLPGVFGGHRRARLYGRLDCPSALRALARGGYVRDRVFFADEETAVRAGYRPCSVCLPERYRRWKVLSGASLVAVGHSRDEPSRAAAAKFVRESEAGGGLIASIVDWPESAASWLRFGQRLMAGSPDAWVIAAEPAGWAKLVFRLRANGWSPELTYWIR